jgi:branched-chain amino acid transport system ATP-binding protein
MGLTSAENLRVGNGPAEKALELFPELEPHLKRKAGLLSGGQQQILTLARALATDPQVLLADELSLGLAPLIVNRLLQAVREAADRGVGVLLVEQHARQALATADRVCVLQRGRVALEGTAKEIAGRLDEVEQTYLEGPAIEPPDGTQPA